MAQSLSNILIHLVFSTKYRQPLITRSIEQELYKYINSIYSSCNSPLITIGGESDHLHSLISISRTYSIADIVEEVKKESSKWIKRKGREFRGFQWQVGYGAFSISPSHINLVKQYISNQKIHHQRRDFKEEFLALLEKYDVEYDPRYIWD